MRKLVYILGGQGSQYFGMASSLYQENAEFRRNMDRLDEVCVKQHGFSVTSYLYDPARGLGDPCDDLAVTNAAIVMLEYSLSELLRSEGVRPDVLVGSSLGEFSAMAIAGRISVETALGFVIEMARVLEKSLPPGGMLAVVGDRKVYHGLPVLHQHTEIASINHDRHFVLSGTTAGLRQATDALEARGQMVIPLPVKYAFHSTALDGVREEITRIGEALAFDAESGGSDANPILVSSTTAEVTTSWQAEDCWHTLRRPISFTDALSAVPDATEALYIDLTPSSTLATIMKTSHPSYRTYPITTPFGGEPAALKKLCADVLP